VSWLNDVSARKERAAVDKIGVPRSATSTIFRRRLSRWNTLSVMCQGRYRRSRLLIWPSMLSRNTTATFASYRLPTGGKQKRGRLSSDDAGWNGAENAGDDLAERFLSASTRAQERAPLNPCRAWAAEGRGYV
jgi:hypothetical protein